MTDERYTLDEFGLNFIVNDNGRNLTAKQTVVRLNAHYEDTQRLKKDVSKLRQENRELKSDFQKLQDSLWTTEKIRELEKENEQLKQQVEDLKFALRTELAHQRTEKEEHSDSVYDFKKKLEKW